MKVGSLFAGIGGFDLGFERAGFDAAWCVEWDKNAQAVLRKRFPNAQVYGDIREVDPGKLERVDVICGGFPCQDLSVAGKRAGLAGERSGLFHDAMRIVRRLRPSVIILENVPGLLSSNRGLDFATVLREVGEGWDCAEVGWRVLDSQYFGVAQRRRRVFVVAGSRIGCAEQILALAEGGGGDPPSRDKAREDASADAARCFAGTRESAVAAPLETTAHDYSRADGFNMVVGTIDCDIPKQRVQNFCAGHWIPCAIQGNLIGRDQGGPQGVGAREDGTMYTLTKTDIHAVAFRKSKRAQTADDDETWVDDGLANTLNGFDTGDTRTTHAVTVAFGMDSEFNGRIEQMGTLKRGGQGGTQNCVAHAFYSTGGTHGLEPHRESHQNGGGQIAVAFKVGNSSKARSDGLAVEQSPTLGSSAGGNTVPAVAVDVWNQTIDGECSATLTSATGGTNTSGPKVLQQTIVRRLTPVECERLQGFPDGWTQIGTDRPTADTHRYKQLGNAVTVNVAEWIARRTMAWLT